MVRNFVVFLLLISFSFPTSADPIPGAALKPASQEQEEEATMTILGRRWFKDAELVGPYGQPAWTTAKRFSNTHVYVLPPGSAAFEYWLESKGELEAESSARFRSNYELEIGLGAHLQLDLYLFTEQGEGYAPLELAGEQIELRWALADWGLLWGNPTLYLEWIRRHEAPQRLEGKLLLGDAINSRLFWGFNLVYERELGGEATQEYAVSGGLSWSWIDGFLNLGVETKVELEDLAGSRFDFSEVEWLLGPALQVRPLPGLHVDLIPMAGLEWEDGEVEPIYAIFFLVGKDFGAWLPGTQGEPMKRSAPQESMSPKVSVLPTAPWSLSYHDGSNNAYRVHQENATGPILFDFHPVQAAESSSGIYSGGKKRKASLSSGQAEEIWNRLRELESTEDARAENRVMGSGLFRTETASAKGQFVIKRTAELDAFEDLLKRL